MLVLILLYRIVTYRIKIDITNPITPPNLLGIEYANKKYHSGLIWVGVFIGFAILKLSGSPEW